MLAFSARVPSQLAPNALARARRRLAGRFVDLTVTNPTLCGFHYPPDLLGPLAHPRGLRYNPAPLGDPKARRALSAHLARQGLAVEPARLFLTASTSESYAFLCKLLCTPGEAVLVPTPSYPLFEHLLRLEGVRAVPYPLREEGGWSVEAEELRRAPRGVKAVVVVHPNNPTGTLVGDREAARLVQLCAVRGWALIADEVFLPFPLEVARPPQSFLHQGEVLTFTLGGLSKLAALPQLKVAWTAVSGPPHQVQEALERLEFIADTYLSVATPTQGALAALLRRTEGLRRQVLARCRANLGVLRQALAAVPGVDVPRVEGGWSAVVRVPRVGGEEELVLHLLQHFRVAVHPGYFFDFPREGYLVVSLLPATEVFRRGAERLRAGLASWLGRP